MANYEFPRPALTTDCVVFGLDELDLKVLLIQRDIEPFAGGWALPGGFVRVGESLDDCARRELAEEAGLKSVYLEQLGSFGQPDRDPREHTVTVAYYALVNLNENPPTAATDARNADWFALDRVPKLAFDHDAILATALERLKNKIRYQPIGFELLPELFTLTQLQKLYEKILNRSLDKRNFRKKFLKLGVLEATEQFETESSRRPARLHRFDHTRYQALIKEGYDFDLQHL